MPTQFGEFNAITNVIELSLLIIVVGIGIANRRIIDDVYEVMFKKLNHLTDLNEEYDRKTLRGQDQNKKDN